MVKINLIVIGNAGTGKTSLVECYKDLDDNIQNQNQPQQNQNFSHQYMPTLGVNLVQKDIVLEENKIKLCIWDTAGEEKFLSLTKQYFRQADGVILVFDITDLESFNKVKDYWIQQVDDKSEENVKKILIGNKADLQSERQVSIIQGHELAEQFDMKYFETSSKTNEYVVQAFGHLTKQCIQSIDQDQIDDPIIIEPQPVRQNSMDKVKSFFSKCF